MFTNPLQPVKDSNILLKRLLFYFGVLQLLHITLLALSLYTYLQHSSLAVLAPAPVGGWSAQAQKIFLGMGLADALNAGFSVYFLYCFFTRKKRWLYLGLMNLALVHFSALIFGYAVLCTGAGVLHPVHYLVMTLLFLPTILLFFLLILRGFQSHSASGPNL